MDINGKQVVKGAGPGLISGVADATAQGSSEHAGKQWIQKFSNGIKIQSDVVDVTADGGPIAFALPEAYTDDHYVTVVSVTEALGTGNDEVCCHAEIPTDASGKKLTHVDVENINASDRMFTYISIGRDLV